MSVIGLVGEETARVGDPSFRSRERKMLDADSVSTNAAPIRRTVETLLAGKGAKVVSNSEWLSDMGLLDFLTQTGKHFTMSRMMSFESVAERLGSGLTFLEFSYMLLQARDSLELHDRFGCGIQVGGSDQWANILCGVDLVRKERSVSVSGITCPLLTRSDGRKMGKSDGKAVWLDESMTSNFDFWQFWRNTPDDDVERFLKIFSEVPLDECEDLSRMTGEDLSRAKIRLADEVTSMVRGQTAASASRVAAIADPDDIRSLGGLPKISIGDGMTLMRALQSSGVVSSSKAAKRAISEGVKVSGRKVHDPLLEMSVGNVISFGKKKFLIEE